MYKWGTRVPITHTQTHRHTHTYTHTHTHTHTHTTHPCKIRHTVCIVLRTRSLTQRYAWRPNLNRSGCTEPGDDPLNQTTLPVAKKLFSNRLANEMWSVAR